MMLLIGLILFGIVSGAYLIFSFRRAIKLDNEVNKEWKKRK